MSIPVKDEILRMMYVLYKGHIFPILQYSIFFNKTRITMLFGHDCKKFFAIYYPFHEITVVLCLELINLRDVEIGHSLFYWVTYI